MNRTVDTYGPPPLLALSLSVLCQAAGFSAGVLIPGTASLPFLPLVGHSVVAAALARLLQMSAPWILLNVLLPLGISVVALQLIPSWIIALLAVAALLTYLPTFWTRVPFYPSRASAITALEEMLPSDEEFSFVDLGSGFGKVILALAPKFPNAKFVGVELSPMPFFISWIRGLRHKNVSFAMKSFWEFSLREFNYTYAFLSPTPMKRLWKKVSEELEGEQVFITNSFMVEATPDKVIELDDNRQNALHVFDMGSSQRKEQHS
jgi:hypothetical protein